MCHCSGVKISRAFIVYCKGNAASSTFHRLRFPILPMFICYLGEKRVGSTVLISRMRISYPTGSCYGLRVKRERVVAFSR